MYRTIYTAPFDPDFDNDATSDTNTYPRDNETYTEFARAESIPAPDVFAGEANEVTATFHESAIRLTIARKLSNKHIAELSRFLQRGIRSVHGAARDEFASVSAGYTALRVSLKPGTAANELEVIRVLCASDARRWIEEHVSIPDAKQMSLF